jgi:hypothetical protein
MRYLKIFGLIGLMLAFAPFANAQRWSVGVGIGPVYGGYGPAYVGPPVCSYGYYDYYPYACAPYGFYGPGWFDGGVFIGAGPWYRGGFYGRSRFNGGFGGYPRGFVNRGPGGFGGAGVRSSGGGSFRGGSSAGSFRGGSAAGSFRGGSSAGSFRGGSSAGSFRGGSSGGSFRGGGGGAHGGGRR